jgi:hypothetical protein
MGEVIVTNNFWEGLIWEYMLGRPRRWEENIMTDPTGTGC